MPLSDRKVDYVSWSDVMEMARYLEFGFGCRIRFTLVVACPKGEQFPKLYLEAAWCDDNLQPRALPRRILARFPNAGSKTMAGLLLGMLYELENAISEVAIWSEPVVGRRPDVPGAA